MKCYVIGSCRISIERFAAACPYIDEVGCDGLSVGIEDPAALDERGEEIDALRDAKSKANELDRTAQGKCASLLFTSHHRKEMKAAASSRK